MITWWLEYSSYLIILWFLKLMTMTNHLDKA